jgi:hypothetical protein
MAAPWVTRAQRGLDTWSLKGGPLLVGPDLAALAQEILKLSDVDVTLKEPLRKRLKGWQERVLGQMKAQAPDDPGTGKSRIVAALKIKRPYISRRRRAIYASFYTDTAYLARHVHDYYKPNKPRPAHVGIMWALSQHEDLTLRHSRGGAKFMERPFKAAGSQVDSVIEGAWDEVKAKVERVGA